MIWFRPNHSFFIFRTRRPSAEGARGENKLKRKNKNKNSIAKARPLSGGKKKTNYKIGYQFEYKTMTFLRKNGYYVIRSYGSKGLYDIIAVPPSNGTFHNYPLLIQAKKNGYVHPEEMERLRKHSSKWQGWPLISYSKPHINKNGIKGKNSDLLFRSLDGVVISNESLRMNQ